MSTLVPIVIHGEYTVLGVPNTNQGVHTLDLTGNVAIGNTTYHSVGNSTANSSSTNGYTVLPGGVLLQWGSGIANTTGNTQSFPVPFPNTLFSFSVTGTQANIITSSANSTKLNVTSSAGNPTYNYIALGK